MPNGDPLQVGVSGLKVFQRTLNTIGHNISNSQTDGYSRQIVDLATNPATPTGNGFIGTGVRATNIARMFDQNATDQVRARTSTNQYFSTYYGLATQVDNLIADNSAGLSPSLQSFFDSVQKVADDPTSTPAREVMLTQANALTDRFKTMQTWFSDLQKTVNSQVQSKVSTVNQTVDSIAQINQQIINAKSLSANAEPNDLLDKRDVLINDLSKSMNVSVLQNQDGTVNVYAGSGHSLVIGTQSMHLEAKANPDDPFNSEVYYVDPSSKNLSPISSMISGGDLGGALKFRSDILLPAMNNLGRLAVAVSDTFNTQHQKGMDLNNQTNNDFFKVPPLNAVANSSNTGPVTGVSIALNNVKDLTTDEYQLTYDGANYVIRNPATNETFTPGVAVPGPPNTTLNTFKGMDITIQGGTPNVGDVFYIRPMRDAASQIGVAISDPNSIAAANPLRSEFNASNNLGDGQITQPTIVNSADPNLQQPVTITFTNSGALASPATADQFSVSGTGTGNPAGVAYVNGGTISYNGWQVQISGTPKVGDTFTINPNTGGFSDNRNAMIGGQSTFHEAYSNLVVDVGNKTSQANISQQAQSALLTQAKDHQASISGVNLDEEAANLMRFQQAYTAAAQVITTANNLFNTLMTAVRG